jgi:large subunit ribosomal protein L9
MEVILRENVTSLGKVGDVVKVKRGYAQNYLLPQRLAYLATGANKKRLEAERQALEAKEATRLQEAEQLKAKIEVVTVSVAKQAGEEDKLYGSVTATDIEHALAEKDVSVDRKMVAFGEAIKTLGEHEVHIHVYADVVATLKVIVTAV